MKKLVTWLVIIIVFAAIGYYAWQYLSGVNPGAQPAAVGSTQTTTTEATSTEAVVQPQEVIGRSAKGNPIVAYHYVSAQGSATSTKEILFVGGIHGGYEWNTVAVANQLMQYLSQHPEAVPANEMVTVIPALNPDGLQTVVGTTSPSFAASSVNPSQSVQVSGRFNGDTVDLNRNFDCDWQAQGTWQNKAVSGGASAFSEPEAQAMKQYIESHRPAAVIVWYSSAGGVFSSNCHNGVLPETSTLTSVFAAASGYPAHTTFDYYAVTGDMTNWLAKIGVPAISVLLTNHTDTEWSKNLAGVQAVLQHYAQ
jgi:predicted deacylase